MLGRRSCARTVFKDLNTLALTRLSSARHTPSCRTGTLASYSGTFFKSIRRLQPPVLPFISQDTGMALRHSSSYSTKTHSKSTSSTSSTSVSDSEDENHAHGHQHSHSHSHSVFGHSHSHDDGPSQDVESIVKVFEGNGDRGSRITLVGLVVNVGLTASKGAAGWMMNSAALLAEAGHSASDLLGDFVTLFAWRFSRQQPTLKYPYGFGKFETLGTTTVAIILIGGALGIGVHSLALLSHHLVETAAALPPGPAQTLLQNVTETAQTVVSSVPSTLSDHGHSHSVAGSHGHGHESLALDPNAAWFALLSVFAKEWLYRATKRVASDEHSSVLLANAVHHRADAYTSAVALIAILGTWQFPALPLDPLGGLLVALVILKQGVQLFAGSFNELTDGSVKVSTRKKLEKAARSLVGNTEGLEAVEEVRAMRAGALLFVDVRIRVPGSLTMDEAAAVEQRLCDVLRGIRKEIFEVRVKYVPVNEDGTSDKGVGIKEKRVENGH